MGFRYKAFISYSHRDSRWAAWLLQALETYRLPDTKLRGVGKLFRDRDEAGASDLRDEIQRALEDSEHLIVIASPNSARSRYVDAEITSFAAANATREAPGKILTLIVDGEPNAAGAAAAIECFPPALRGGALKPDGTPYEPLAADARAVGDGRVRALAKLVAGLMDIRYDSLVRRDLKRRQRARLLLAAASVATLAIAGVVSAVIVSGNLEQDRLRVASETAARETRTVEAVNNAERARRLLDGGNPAAARALARQSLPLDGSIPFVPQAYDVLFRSTYDRAQEVDVDLAGYFKAMPVVVPLGDGHTLVANDDGTAAIWTASAGVVYRRADLAWGVRPALTPDGSTLFIAGQTAMLRLTLPGRVWSEVDLTPVFGDLSMPSYMAAIDSNSLYACHESQLIKIAIDAAARGSAVWRLAMPVPCTGLALLESGAALVALGVYAAEVDATSGLDTKLYGPTARTVERVYAKGSTVILSHADASYIYRNGAAVPETIARGMDYDSLSPDGRWFIYSDVDNERLVINDLSDGSARDFPCVCLFGAFLDNERFITSAAGSIAAHRLDTLASLGVIHAFDSEAESYTFLPADNMLVALRRQGSDSVAFLDDAPNPTRIADGTKDFRTSLWSAAFTGDDRLVVRSIAPEGAFLQLLDLSAGGLAAPVAGSEVGGYGTLAFAVPLAGGKLAVVDPLTDRYGFDLTLLDGTSGKTLSTDYVLADPNLRPGDRFAGIDGVDGMSIYDAASGERVPFPDGAFDLWEIEGDVLVGAYFVDGEGGVEAYRIGQGPPTPLWEATVDSQVSALCLASGKLYLSRGEEDGLLLERRSIDDGVADTQLAVGAALPGSAVTETRAIECDAASLRFVGFTGQQWRWDVAGAKVHPERAGTAPRPEGEIAEVTALEAVADGVIGWDDDGAWLYDPSANAVAVVFATAGGRLSSSLYIASRGLAVLGYESGRVEIWDVRYPSAAMVALEAHQSPVVALDYAADRQLLLSADGEGTMHVWPIVPAPELIAGAGD